MSSVEVERLLSDNRCGIIDVRTPTEFAQGHIPGAINIPLFSDDERAIVGTLYKQDGHEVAFDRGLTFVGDKLSKIIKQVRALQNSKIVVYCWRGGLRSSSVVWILKMAGINVVQLSKGYKNYRSYIRSYFRKQANIHILGGRTGVGKTRILKELALHGEQMIDLEGLANHMGSSFGKTTNDPQPTNEQFENNCFDIWKGFNLRQRIWIESESRNIGKVSIVEELYSQMRIAPMLYVETSIKRRMQHILADYSGVSSDLLIASCFFIKKKLGDRYNKVISLIEGGELEGAILILLEYYDYLYDKTAKKNRRETKNIFWGEQELSCFAKTCCLK